MELTMAPSSRSRPIVEEHRNRPSWHLVAVPVGLIVSLLGPAWAAEPPLFPSTFPSFETADYPTWVAIGDFNGDGKPDFAVAALDTVSVLLGNGDGTFSARTDYVIGPVAFAFCVAVGDLNSDGSADLVTANYGANTASVLLGHGDGTFGARSDFEAGTTPASVAIGDLNADGHLDIVFANDVSNGVSVMLGNGDGTFGTRNAYGVGTSPTSVAIGDLNRDGKLDLAVAEYRLQTIGVLLGNGDGTFGPRGYAVTGVGPSSVAIGELNGDGNPDLAVANVASNTISVVLGNGDGTFGVNSEYATGRGPRTIAMGDLDADGKQDLAVSIRGTDQFSVFLGNGDGSLGAKSDHATGAYPVCLAIGDVEGDGRMDVLVANDESHTVSVHLNSGVLTATLLSLFEAEWVGASVEVRWQLEAIAGVAVTTVDRKDAGSGHWVEISGELQNGQGVHILVDRGVEPGHEYSYMLRVTLVGGETMDFGPVFVKGTPVVMEFELGAITPSPSRGVSEVAFATPKEARVRIVVLDVLGRRVALLAEGTYPPGRHEVVWNAGRGSVSALAGLYFVRFEWPGGSATRRLALIQ